MDYDNDEDGSADAFADTPTFGAEQGLPDRPGNAGNARAASDASAALTASIASASDAEIEAAGNAVIAGDPDSDVTLIGGLMSVVRRSVAGEPLVPMVEPDVTTQATAWDQMSAEELELVTQAVMAREPLPLSAPAHLREAVARHIALIQEQEALA
jgi:hypothetical protein